MSPGMHWRLLVGSWQDRVRNPQPNGEKGRYDKWPTARRMVRMNIGEPERTIEFQPVEEPVPGETPADLPLREPEEAPASG